MKRFVRRVLSQTRNKPPGWAEHYDTTEAWAAVPSPKARRTRRVVVTNMMVVLVVLSLPISAFACGVSMSSRSVSFAARDVAEQANLTNSQTETVTTSLLSEAVAALQRQIYAVPGPTSLDPQLVLKRSEPTDLGERHTFSVVDAGHVVYEASVLISAADPVHAVGIYYTPPTITGPWPGVAQPHGSGIDVAELPETL